MKQRLISLLLVLVLLLTAAQPILAASREDWTDWTVIKEPTCTREGERTRTSTLGNVQTEVIYPTGHTPGEWVITREATCISREQSQVVCVVCGEVLETMESGDFGPHQWGKWEDVEEEPGVPVLKKQRTCKVCGLTEEQDISLRVLPDPPEEEDPAAPTISLTAETEDPGPFVLGDHVKINVRVRNTSSITLYFSERNRQLDESYPTELAPDEECMLSETIVIDQYHLDKAEDHDMYFGLEYEVWYSKYKWYNYDDKHRAHGKDTVWIPLQGTPTPSILLTGELASPGPYGLGDEVEIHLTLKNRSDVPMTYFKTKEIPPEKLPEELEPKGTYDFTVVYKLTEEDILAGPPSKYRKRVWYSASYKYNGNNIAADTAEIVIPLTLDTGKEPTISLTAALTNTEPVKAGENAVIQLTLKNTAGRPLTFVSSSVETEPEWPKALESEQEVSLTVYFGVNQEMIDEYAAKGYQVPFELWTWYENSYSQPAIGTAGTEVPLQPGGEIVEMPLPPAVPAPEGGLSLSVPIVDGAKEPYYAFDEIHFRPKITNTGEQDLINVRFACTSTTDGKLVEVGSLEKGKTVDFNFYYTVKPEEASSGVIDLKFSAYGWIQSEEEPVWAEPVNQKLSAAETEDTGTPNLVLSAACTPPENPALNTVVGVKLTLQNQGKVPVTVTGLDVSGDTASSDNRTSWDLSAKLPIEAKGTHSGDYLIVISDDDIALGKVKRTFTVRYTAQDETGKELKTNEADVDFEIAVKPNAGQLSLSCVSDLACSRLAGEQVGATFTLINTGSVPLTMYSVVVCAYEGKGTDADYGDNLAEWGKYTTLEPGNSPIPVRQYTNVVGADLSADNVHREVYVVALDPDGAEVYSNVACMDVPLLPTEPDSDEDEFLKVVLERKGEPDNGKGYVPGEKIHYIITVTNIGKETVHALGATHSLNASAGFIEQRETLSPSDAPWVISFDYQVTEKELSPAMILINEALISYDLPDHSDERWAHSNKVEAPLDEEEGILPPEGPTDEPTPADGPVDPFAQDECLRVLTAKSDSESEYVLTFCDEHAAIDGEICAAIASAMTDDERLSAYRAGIDRWSGVLDQLVQQLPAHTAMEAWAGIAESHAAFRNALNAVESLMKDTLGKTDMEAAALVLDLLRLRCVDLCYALHRAPNAKRIDSVQNGSFEELTAARPEENAFDFTGSDGAYILWVQLKPELAEIEAELTGRQRSAVTPKVAADAFSDAELGYRIAISLKTAQMLLNVHREARHAAIVWQECVFASLDADLALYLALYPDHPETAAEIVCRTARDMLVCIGN